MMPFLVLGVPGGCFHFNCILNRNYCNLRVLTRVRVGVRSVASELAVDCFHNTLKRGLSFVISKFLEIILTGITYP